ncbi:MAG: vWA domain-containing protein [Planctomycetota bacterium]
MPADPSKPEQGPGLNEAAGPVYLKEAVAWLTSLALHLAILVALATASVFVPSARRALLEYEPPEVLEEPEPLPSDFVSSEEPTEEIGALAQGGLSLARSAASIADEESLALFEPRPVSDFGLQQTVVLTEPDFKSPELSDDLPTQGSAIAGAEGAVGAIDRLTHEILASLETGPTLVVWLFDRSGSLEADRKQIVRRFGKIYEELGVIEAAENPVFEKHSDKPLLSVVVGFGETAAAFLKQPTDRVEEVQAAVSEIENDPAGRENVFGAVAEVAQKYRNYRLARNGARNVMIVVFTDESGDDVHRMEETIDLCRKLAMPVYVVGRPSPFGRRSAYVRWVDPDPNFDQRPQWIPVNMGPESLLPERLRLSPVQSEPLFDSGFGPFALTRLCYETQGIYFSTRSERKRSRPSRDRGNDLTVRFERLFDEAAMRRYEPDYLPAPRYMEMVQSNPARRALVAAAELSWSLPDEVSWSAPLVGSRRRFLKVDDGAFVRSLNNAQQRAALCLPALNGICNTLIDAEGARDGLKKPRWKAGYDLAVGRALNAKVRADGYNEMLARAKSSLEFQDENNNTWVIRPDEALAGSLAERLADKARERLEAVVSDHSGTPWALLAQQELRVPVGWRWDETYTPVAPPREGSSQPRREPTPRTPPPRRNPPAL